MLNVFRRLWCDHENATTEEYDLFGGGTYWDERGEYRPYFKGVEHICPDCGKTWATDVEPYRYYIDRERNPLEKVNKMP